MKTLLRGGLVFMRDEFVKADVLFDNTVLAVGKDLTGYDRVVDCRNRYVTPGFIDIHIHGREGFSVTEDCQKVAQLLPKYGITAFLPTTLTLSAAQTIRSLRYLSDYIDHPAPNAAEALGIYSEGLFFSKDKCGAQNPAYIKEDIDISFIEEMIEASRNKIKVLALAPENKGAEQAVEFLKSRHIRSSMAHTDALYSDVEKCIEKGLDGVTHIFNGMRWMNHLELGASGAGVFADRLYAELIADGFHVNKEFIKILFRFKPHDKIIFISDNVPLSGLPEGTGDMSGVPVKITKDKLVVDNDNGVYSLAGSCLKLCDSIKNVAEFTGIQIEKLIKCVTENPAKYIGADKRKGSIEAGKDADINIFDKGFGLIKTYVKGELV